MIQEETPVVPENKKEISIKRVFGKSQLDLRFREWDWLIIKKLTLGVTSQTALHCY